MNDKQKEIALEMSVVHARMSADRLSAGAYLTLSEQLGLLLAAFDIAADAPKRKYTVESIRKPHQIGGGDSWAIACGNYEWTQRGWSREAGDVFLKATADAIYAGLVATGNVPKVGE